MKTYTELETLVDQHAESFYLNYVNGPYLTVDRFAENQGLSEVAANAIIKHGRSINHARSTKGGTS